MPAGKEMMRSEASDFVEPTKFPSSGEYFNALEMSSLHRFQLTSDQHSAPTSPGEART